MERTEETRGLALANNAIGFSMLVRLVARGILTKTDADQIFEAALSNLEALPDDEAIRAARIIAEGMRSSLSA